MTWASKPPLPPPDSSLPPELQASLARAAQAAAAAQGTLERLEQLPSARLPTAWDRAAALGRPLAKAAALAAAAAGIHSAGLALRLAGAAAIAALVGLSGWRRGSLSGSGALAAAAVGAATLAASCRAGLTLLAFFFASSALTRLGDEDKAVDEGHKAGGQRDWRQVRGVQGATGAVHARALQGGGRGSSSGPRPSGPGCTR